MSIKQPKVLIVILNYGTYELTINLIKEVKSKLKYENYSFMVIDNCSPNESANILEKDSLNNEYLFYANRKNTGYAAGNNIGIRYGIEHGYDYTWILNNDVLLREDDILNKLVQVAESNPKIASVGPKVYSSKDKVVAPYCNRPSLWNMTLGAKFAHDYRISQAEMTREVYCVYGCCVLLRNSAMNEVDCMDERTFLYGEENILAERLIAKGYISYYVPEVSIKHNEGSSTTRMSLDKIKVRIKENNKSRELYLKEYRHFSAPARWLCHLTRSLIMYVRN